MEQMQNQMNNNMGMNFNNNLNNQTINPINEMNNIQSNQNTINPNNMIQQNPEPLMNGVNTNEINQMNNQQPMENNILNVPTESMYQPLSEQKPIIPPQPVPNFNTVEPNINVQPQQDNNYNIGDINNNNNNIQQNLEMMPNINQQPEMNMMPSPNYNNIVMQPQMAQENNNFTGQTNFNQNNTTIPQPII